MRICCVHFCCQSIPQLQNYLSLRNYIPGKLNWSFCVVLCTQNMCCHVVAMTGWLSCFTTWVKEITFKCELLYTVIHREMLAS